MSERLALLGAGGKMGQRITSRLHDDPAYDVRYVEPDADAAADLEGRFDVATTPRDEALVDADVVVLAVPDEVMGEVAAAVAPRVPEGALVMTLDPAAAHAGALPEGGGVAYFVSHPCHPPLYAADRELGAAGVDEPDWFGGQGMAEQHIVCALHSGPEAAYDRGEAVARDIYAPVGRAHRVTTEEMAILEPALSETLAATCVAAVREGMDRAVEMGVPREAARDFLLGHLRIEVAILFGMTDFPFSDGAQRAIEEAKAELFRDGWLDRVFDPGAIEASVEEIAGVAGTESDG